jgi:hypothetical protein
MNISEYIKRATSISLFIVATSLITPDAELHSSFVTLAFMLFTFENGIYIFRKRHLPCALLTLLYIVVANISVMENITETCNYLRVLEYITILLVAFSTYHLTLEDQPDAPAVTSEYVELE